MARKYKQLTHDQKVKILTLSGEGHSSWQISSRIGCAQSTVVRFFKKKENQNPMERKKGTGPKRKTSTQEDRILTRISLKDRFKSAVQIKAELNKDHNIDLSAETVRRRLREVGLFGRKPAKKPFLTKKMKAARLAWAKKYENWTEENWRQVVWSDESKFITFCSDSTPYVRRKPGEKFNPKCVVSTVKFPPSTMVWGCFSFYMKGELRFLEQTMDAKYYKRVITENLVPAIEEHLSFTSSVIFQDDSAPSHRAKSVNSHLQDLGVKRLDWPGNSPDLNPIEHLWHIMKRKVAANNPTNKSQLVEVLGKVWADDISTEILQNLVNSMTSRIQAVIEAKGGPTRY